MEINKGFELKRVSVRLVNDGMLLHDEPLNSPEQAVEVMGDYLREMDREVLMVLNLTSNLKPINCSVVSVGAINETIASPREILKCSILSNASNIMLMHNHPSGNLTPSKQDTMMTERMINMCAAMNIPLIDHIIVGAGNPDYFSFSEKEVLKKPCNRYTTNYMNIEFDKKVAEDMEEPERSR